MLWTYLLPPGSCPGFSASDCGNQWCFLVFFKFQNNLWSSYFSLMLLKCKTVFVFTFWWFFVVVVWFFGIFGSICVDYLMLLKSMAWNDTSPFPLSWVIAWNRTPKQRGYGSKSLLMTEKKVKMWQSDCGTQASSLHSHYQAGSVCFLFWPEGLMVVGSVNMGGETLVPKCQP